MLNFSQIISFRSSNLIKKNPKFGCNPTHLFPLFFFSLIRLAQHVGIFTCHYVNFDNKFFCFVYQGFLLVPEFFEKSELEPIITAICELVDGLAEKLYSAGKIKGKTAAFTV